MLIKFHCTVKLSDCQTYSPYGEIDIAVGHPSYDPKSTLQSFGKKPLQMGYDQKKCKVLLKDASRCNVGGVETTSSAAAEQCLRQPLTFWRSAVVPGWPNRLNSFAFFLFIQFFKKAVFSGYQRCSARKFFCEYGTIRSVGVQAVVMPSH